MTKIPIWSIFIHEESNGHFIGRALGELGHTVEYSGGDEVEERILESVFGIESVLSNPYIAAISVIISFHRLAKLQYSEQSFGSWLIECNNEKLAYNGKDGWVEHFKNGASIRIMHWDGLPKLSDLKYCVTNFTRK